jgi:molecular chaperone GrpE
MKKDDVLQRDHGDPGSIADGDAQLDQEPSGVTEAEPPSGPALGGAEDDAVARESQLIDADLDALQRDLASASDRYLRLAAEFDNYRKRVDRERADLWGRAQADLAGRLLDALDDLERVAQHVTEETPILQGVQLVERKLRQALETAGLEQVDADGASFDPNSMEAVAMVGTDVHEEDDTVSDVFQKGYFFKGMLIRPARVRVKKHGA